MRTLLMVMMIVGLMSTVGVYAAGIGGAPTIKTIGGSGDETVGAPASAVSLAWVMTGDTVTGVNVTWTPAAAGDYDIDVGAGGNTGNLNIASSGTVSRTDAVTISSTEASAITTAKVVISQN